VLVLLLQYTDNKVLCGRYERVTRMYLPQASVENEYREPPKNLPTVSVKPGPGETLDQCIHVLYHISGGVIGHVDFLCVWSIR